MIENGKKVEFNYIIKIEDADTGGKKQKFEYTHGERKIIPKLEKGLEGLNVGDKKTIQLSAESGHIPHDPNRVKEVEKSTFKNDQQIEVGKRVDLKDKKSGEMLSATIIEIKDENLVVDFNHPLAGKDIEFNIEVLSIQA
jgi:FKBP-type peptidyl-prolyl cis-trans isomerase 2